MALMGGLLLLPEKPSVAASPGSVPYWRSEEGMTAQQINRQRAQQEAMRLQGMQHRMRMEELRARRPRVYVVPQPSPYRYYQQPWAPAVPMPQPWFPGSYYGYYGY